MDYHQLKRRGQQQRAGQQQQQGRQGLKLVNAEQAQLLNQQLPQRSNKTDGQKQHTPAKGEVDDTQSG